MKPEKQIWDQGALNEPFARIESGGISFHAASLLSLELPVGFLRCTYEKYPKVLYASDGMLAFLGMTPDSEQWQEMICQNIFFMIPSDSWNAFRAYLDAAGESDEPVSLEHQVNHSDGVPTYLTGWLKTVETASGDMEFHIVYIETPKSRINQQQMRERAYQKALGNVYDIICVIDRTQQTMELIHQKKTVQAPDFRFARFMIDNVSRHDIFQHIYSEDRGPMEEFVQEISRAGNEGISSDMARKTFRAGKERLSVWEAVAVELTAQTVLLCSRKLMGETQSDSQNDDAVNLRLLQTAIEEKEDLSPEQVIAFYLANGRMFPAIGKKMICRQFHMADDEYARLQEEGIAVSTFLEYYGISRKAYQAVLRDGEAIMDAGQGAAARRMRIFKNDAVSEDMQGHTILFLYNFNGNPGAPAYGKSRVFIRTFGYFDIFVDGKPVVFHYEKSKEILAVLVDRYGSFVSNPYIINCLWEDEPYGEKIQGRCRQAVHRMMQVLKEYGIADIIEQVSGKRRIVPERVQCDYFDYMSGDKSAERKFNGAYMSDYSWGEVTLSNLIKAQETG